MQLKCLITVFLLADYDCHAWYCVVDQRMTGFPSPYVDELSKIDEWVVEQQLMSTTLLELNTLGCDHPVLLKQFQIILVFLMASILFHQNPKVWFQLFSNFLPFICRFSSRLSSDISCKS